MTIGMITGVILAGGENRRFPSLKAFIKIANYKDNHTIIERNLKLLKGIFNEVFISTNMPEKYFYLDAPLIGDVLPSRGPMSGIYSSLINAKSDCIFVIACDMPFVKREVVSVICEKHLEMSSIKQVDATIPVFNDEPQPLFGVYCKTALPYLENCILNEKTSMKRLLSEINTNFIGESDIMKIDPTGRSFVNINTMEDYERIAHSSSLMDANKKTMNYEL
jgi:molybdopterin-guanine dinucleotide biosynthesis protein A